MGISNIHGFGAQRPHRSERRRLMAVLRLAHKCLGFKRRGLALGLVGPGALAAVVLASAGAHAADATCVIPGTNTPIGDVSAAGDQVACGQGAIASGTDATAIGVGARAEGNYSTAIGEEAHTTGPFANAMGYQATAGGQHSIAIGSLATVAGDGTIGIGDSAGTGSTATFSTFIGNSAGNNSSGYNQIAIGMNAGDSSSGQSVVFIGSLAGMQSNGHFNSAIGWQAGARVEGDANTAMGTSSGDQVTGTGNSALGFAAGTAVTGNQNLSLGFEAGFGTQGNDNIGLGFFGGGATQGNANIALGNMAGVATVGDDNLTMGNLAGASQKGNRNISFGYNAGATIGDINDPSTWVATNANDTIALGSHSFANADMSVAIGSGAQSLVTNNVSLGAGSVDRAYTQVTGADVNGMQLTGFAGTATGVVSVGAQGAERQIVNVAPGEVSSTSTDAVNGSQLYSVATKIDSMENGGGIKYFHANSTAADSQATGAESVAAGPASVASGTGSVAMGSGANAAADGGVAIGQGAVANNAGDVALGENSVTQAAVGTAGTTIRGQDYSFAGAAPAGTVSVGDVGSERTITNVAAGRLSRDSTDAVNGSQLNATNQAVENIEAGVGQLDEFAVKYDKNTDGTRANSVTLIGGDPNAPVVLSNVADGVKSSDAANVGQLQAGLSNTLVQANDYTDTRVNWAVDTANSYTDQVAKTTLNQANDYTDYKFGQMNADIDGVRSEARQAAAIGLAAASLRYDDRPGKASVAMGGGVWRSKGALAFGAGYTSENSRLRANVSATTAGGHWGAGAGLSFTLN
ncbi:YadA-like family protein [Mesorhizobium sp. SP-1A]|uniref:YadA-like family protein n=1 Tax=Mesorhizobium sp. SP-1A TaxID=3077840 RepID=UPI0028F74C0E|nr:YadA-like family protein [Mesorhizobium sp. SP-1A]